MVQRYRYYDTPDGEDYIKKQYYLLKHAVPIGSAFACLDLFQSKGKGFIPIIDRMVRVFSRPLLMTLVFEPTVYITTKLTKKDHPMSHVVGGVATMYYVSRFFPNTSLLMFGFIPVSFALFLYKEARSEYDTHFGPDVLTVKENLDHSLFSDFLCYHLNPEKFPRNYLTVNEAIQKGYIQSLEDGVARGLVPP